jgi:guanylate kinase
MVFGGRVFIITGPSGSGKSTIADKILKEFSWLGKVITCTTRKKRVGEKNGVDYLFFSRKKFEELLKKGAFVEHAVVYNEYYGSLKSEVEKVISSGRSVLFVVDVQGAFTVSKVFPGAVSIFVKAPSLAVLRERLVGRGKDSLDKINERLKIAEKELGFEDKFGFVLVNDKLDIAVEEAKRIFLSADS